MDRDESRQKRVFVVEGHSGIRAALSARLGKMDGVEVIGAGPWSAQTAEIIGRSQPDVVLLEVKSAGVDGVKMCEAILAASPGSQVLVLTSYHDERERRQLLAAGAADYLLKELDWAALYKRMMVVLSHQDTRASPGLPS